MTSSHNMQRDTISRRLRVFTIDPALGGQLATRHLKEVTVKVPWESELEMGPVGEYIEVVDVDHASGVFYSPVDLNRRDLLAQDGLAASETNPQFHQQMVYAVARSMVERFVEAFGRPIFWSNRIESEPKYKKSFVRRLRIYPHALRERNAYYSPSKKALLFGYFPVTGKDAYNTPGTTVFTCLSHDIIAHEVTHALLDGIHPRFIEPSNPDVHAFHEAFADIVALFQRFTYEGVLEFEIQNTRGDLTSPSMLSQLAGQFARATGHGASLRDAIGEEDPETGQWRRREPDPRALERVFEPHERGAILVAAIFQAFASVYTERTRDLVRIASQGTGELPNGNILVDLAKRLADEARQTAEHLLHMCIRAVDYCPPVDITFGDYLRALVTADLDVNLSDSCGYRVALVDAFRAWGIYPRGIRSMSVENLVWHHVVDQKPMQKKMSSTMTSASHKKARWRKFMERDFSALDIRKDRRDIWKDMDLTSLFIWDWLTGLDDQKLYKELGLVFKDAPRTVYRKNYGPTLDVHAVRPTAIRTDAYGSQNLLIVGLLQRRRGYLESKKQREEDEGKGKMKYDVHGDFTYRAGCTLFINPATKDIHWVIRTAGDIANNDELDRMRRYIQGEHVPLANAFASTDPVSLGLAGDRPGRDQFARLHLSGGG